MIMNHVNGNGLSDHRRPDDDLQSITSHRFRRLAARSSDAIFLVANAYGIARTSSSNRVSHSPAEQNHPLPDSTSSTQQINCFCKAALEIRLARLRFLYWFAASGRNRLVCYLVLVSILGTLLTIWATIFDAQINTLWGFVMICLSSMFLGMLGSLSTLGLRLWELRTFESRRQRRAEQVAGLPLALRQSLRRVVVGDAPASCCGEGAADLEAQAGGASFEGQTCSVCLGEYARGETLTLLGCGHHFHADCLDEWLRRRRVCPLCKKPAAAALAAAAAGTAPPSAAAAAGAAWHGPGALLSSGPEVVVEEEAPTSNL